MDNNLIFVFVLIAIVGIAWIAIQAARVQREKDLIDPEDEPLNNISFEEKTYPPKPYRVISRKGKGFFAKNKIGVVTKYTSDKTYYDEWNHWYDWTTCFYFDGFYFDRAALYFFLDSPTDLFFLDIDHEVGMALARDYADATYGYAIPNEDLITEIPLEDLQEEIGGDEYIAVDSLTESEEDDKSGQYEIFGQMTGGGETFSTGGVKETTPEEGPVEPEYEDPTKSYETPVYETPVYETPVRDTPNYDPEPTRSYSSGSFDSGSSSSDSGSDSSSSSSSDSGGSSFD